MQKLIKIYSDLKHGYVRDILISIGFFVFSVFITLFMLLFTNCNPSGTSLPNRTIIQHIIYSEKEELLCSANYSVPAISVGLYNNEWLIVFLPFIVGLPFIMNFADEINSGFYKMKLSRKSFKSYWNKSYLMNGLLGAGSFLIGYLIFILIVSIKFPHINEYGFNEYGEKTILPLLTQAPLNKLFNTESEFILVFQNCLTLLMFLILTAQICMFLFTLTMNRYKSIGLPMVCFYLMDQIAKSLFDKQYNPKYLLLSPSNIAFVTPGTMSGAGIDYYWYFIAIIVILVLLYLVCGKILKGRIMC